MALTTTVFAQEPAPAKPAPAVQVPANGAGAVKGEKHTPETLMRFIEGLFSRKFYDMAEEQIRSFLQEYPDHELAPRAMFRLILCLRALDKAPDTLSIINQFHQKWSGHEFAPKLFLYKGELLFQAEKYEQAQACFKRLVLSTDTVTRDAALYWVAECYAKLARTDLALQTYARIASLPFDGVHVYRPYALFAVASAQHQAKEFSEAAKGFTRLKDEKQVPPGIREEALYRVAEIRFVQKDYKQAIELYELLLVDFADGYFAKEARKRRAWAYFSLRDFPKTVELVKDWRSRYGDAFDYEMEYVHGASLSSMELYGDALPFFRRLTSAADVPPEYWRQAMYQQVYCLLRTEAYAECVEDARAFLAKLPQDSARADVRFFSAEASFRLDDFPASSAGYREALDWAPPEWPYHRDANLRLGDSLENEKRSKEAAAHYRAMSADERMEQRAYFLLRAGEIERELGNWEEAVMDLEGVLAGFPDSAEAKAAMFTLCELYAERQHFDRAEEFLQRILATPEGKDNPRLLFFRGYLFFQQDQFEEAEKYLRQALGAGGAGDVARDAKYFLAGTLLEVDRDDEALAIFAELLTLPADQRPAFEAPLLARLDRMFYARNRYDVSETICRWLLTWEDKDVVYAATLRLALILLRQDRQPEARRLLEKELEAREGTPPAGPEDLRIGQLSSLLGEVVLLAGENDRAVHLFLRALKHDGVDRESAVRARWGLAKILKSEGRVKRALRYAVEAFVLVLGDDPVYTPRAMLIALEIYVTQGSMADAWTTWRELQARFAAFAEQNRDNPSVTKLLAWRKKVEGREQEEAVPE